MTLDKLPVGKRAIIKAVSMNAAKGKDILRNRLLDMGLIPKTEIVVNKIAPMGDPMEITVRNYTLTLRLDDARNIEVEVI